MSWAKAATEGGILWSAFFFLPNWSKFSVCFLVAKFSQTILNFAAGNQNIRKDARYFSS